MRIKSYYDKIGLGFIGTGVDGLFIHSDLSSWMDKLAPYLFLIVIKLLLIVIGIYVLRLYNKSQALEEISLDKKDILERKILLAKRISQYHWYLLILLCFLSVTMNWGNEPGSGLGIAVFLFLFWLVVAWPIIYFWKKNYTNPANTVDLNSLTQREELIKFLFIEANNQHKKTIKIFLLLSIFVPILCAIFPSLIGETEPMEGFFSCLVFIVFITFIIWITSIFSKRKNNKIKNYYLSNKNCKIWASEESQNSLHIKFDEKEIEIAKIFLPFSIEDCIQIVNYDNYQNENTKSEINTHFASETNTDEAYDTSLLNEVFEKYVNKKTFNIPRLLFFSILFTPLGFGFCFVYAYLMWFIPFPFNVIITAVFGVLFGFLFPVKLSKCTNPKVAIFSILLFVSFCHYFGFVVWMDLFINQSEIIEINHPKSPISSIVPSSSNLDQILFLFSNPSIFFSNLSIIAQTGYFGFFSYTPQGFILYVIWLLEWLIILFFSIFTSHERSNEPFCVNKKKWHESFKIKLSYISDLESLKNAFLQGDSTLFENLPPAEKDNSFTEFEVWHLDEEPAFVSLKNHKMRHDEKGKVKYDEQELLKYAKLDSAILQVLKVKSKNNSG